MFLTHFCTKNQCWGRGNTWSMWLNIANIINPNTWLMVWRWNYFLLASSRRKVWPWIIYAKLSRKFEKWCIFPSSIRAKTRKKKSCKTRPASIIHRPTRYTSHVPCGWDLVRRLRKMFVYVLQTEYKWLQAFNWSGSLSHGFNTKTL